MANKNKCARSIIEVGSIPSLLPVRIILRQATDNLTLSQKHFPSRKHQSRILLFLCEDDRTCTGTTSASKYLVHDVFDLIMFWNHVIKLLKSMFALIFLQNKAKKILIHVPEVERCMIVSCVYVECSFIPDSETSTDNALQFY